MEIKEYKDRRALQFNDFHYSASAVTAPGSYIVRDT